MYNKSRFDRGDGSDDKIEEVRPFGEELRDLARMVREEKKLMQAQERDKAVELSCFKTKERQENHLTGTSSNEFNPVVELHDDARMDQGEGKLQEQRDKTAAAVDISSSKSKSSHGVKRSSGSLKEVLEPCTVQHQMYDPKRTMCKERKGEERDNAEAAIQPSSSSTKKNPKKYSNVFIRSSSDSNSSSAEEDLDKCKFHKELSNPALALIKLKRVHPKSLKVTRSGQNQKPGKKSKKKFKKDSKY